MIKIIQEAGPDGVVNLTAGSARAGRTALLPPGCFSPGSKAAPDSPGFSEPFSVTSVSHVFQGPGEAGSAVGARKAATRSLQISALLFCRGRNDGVDHD